MISTVPENDLDILAKLPEQLAFYSPLNSGLLQLKGEDRVRFLHNQTTNNIQSFKSGQNCNTVFVNSTGRTLDLATAYLLEDAIWIKVSPNRRQFLFNWMDRFLFPMDKVELTDISEQYVLVNLLGQQSDDFLQKLGRTGASSPQFGGRAARRLGGQRQSDTARAQTPFKQRKAKLSLLQGR